MDSYDSNYNSQNGMARSRRSAGLENLDRATKAKQYLMELLSWLNKSTVNERSPFRSACLRAHGTWSCQMLFLVFIFSVTSYYGEEPIKCIEHYDRRKASAEVLDICIQFPFTMNASESMRDGKRHYAYNYMYYHWACLLFSLVFGVVGAAVYLFENRSFRKLTRALDDTYDYKERLRKTIKYYQKSYGDHNGMLRNVLIMHLLGLFMNFFVFLGIDSLLHQKYRFMIRFLFIKRDPTFFDDEFSMTFPPFAYCEINPSMHIQVGRTNLYGCHLPLNEIYSIFFVALWCWQVFLFLWCVFDLSHWVYIYCKYENGKDFLFDGSYKKFPDVKQAAKNLNRDEALALSFIKPLLFAPHYRELIQSLASWDPSESCLEVTHVKNPNFPSLLSRLPIVQQDEINNQHIDSFFFDIIKSNVDHLEDIGLFGKFKNDDDGKRKDDECSSSKDSKDKRSKDKDKDKDDKYGKDDKDKSDKKSDKDKAKAHKYSETYEYEKKPPQAYKPDFNKLFDVLVPTESHLKRPYDDSLSSKSTLLSDNPLSLSSFHKSPVNSTLLDEQAVPSAPPAQEIGFKSAYTDMKSEKSDKKSKKKDNDEKDYKYKKEDEDDKNSSEYFDTEETPKTSMKSKKKRLGGKHCNV